MPQMWGIHDDDGDGEDDGEGGENDDGEDGDDSENNAALREEKRSSRSRSRRRAAEERWQKLEITLFTICCCKIAIKLRNQLCKKIS